MKKSSQGFTLLEVTMTITVIALVVAGILTTRSIIRTSQIQAVMGEYQNYLSAIKNFKGKYRALPGDFAGATALWGEVSSNCKFGAGTGTKTCNGDGDSLIEFDVSNYEHIEAWRHLALSGFIKQNFTGDVVAGGACNIDIRGGDNVPLSKLKGAMWNLGVDGSGTAYTTGAPGNQYFPINTCTNALHKHALWLGGSLQDDDAQAAGCAHSQIPIFTGEEAYEIDVKFDDKRAGGGKIRNQYNNTATYETCEDSASTSGGYRVSATGVNCSLVFVIDP
ncbi:MAG: type II secretion system protein [Alphaproteobacteria bacterium]|nr:type II secretion system protein [Alphaproteobacteria bacterium]